jgi:hypothetical protein
VDVVADARERVVVAFALGEREELRRILEAGVDLLERGDGGLEAAAFLAELLGALGVVPDAGVLEGAADLYEARLLRVVVKDTSGARPSGRPNPGGRSRSG